MAAAAEHMLLKDFLWGEGFSIEAVRLRPGTTTRLASLNGDNLSMASCCKTDSNRLECDDLKWEWGEEG